MTQELKDKAIAELRKRLQPGAKVYCVLKHVSASGVTRHISFLITKQREETHEIVCIDHLIAQALGYKRAKDGSVVTQVVGMDAGFEVVYTLGRKLFPEGASGRQGKADSDGGYCLNSYWL